MSLCSRDIEALGVELLVEGAVIGGELRQFCRVVDGELVRPLPPFEAGAGTDVDMPTR
jgi:hypothetical protein